ncbi:MAG: hypothetical protein HC828_19760 [Blastochloris sp.]|nr:hypothetical protein [Blastochloris sp.]
MIDDLFAFSRLRLVVIVLAVVGLLFLVFQTQSAPAVRLSSWGERAARR